MTKIKFDESHGPQHRKKNNRKTGGPHGAAARRAARQAEAEERRVNPDLKARAERDALHAGRGRKP